MADTSSKSNYEDSERVLRDNPKTLLELTTLKTAFCIRNLSSDTQSNILDTVPQTIGKMIESQFEVIKRELEFWHQGSQWFLAELVGQNFYQRDHLVVFGGNGSVHFKATLANFLRLDMDDSIKFKIACQFCLEEYVDIFWPLVGETLHVEDLHFDSDFMMYYWICKKRGELSRVPLGEFKSVEYAMFVKCRKLERRDRSNWVAVEYFFNQLDFDDRAMQINRMVNLGKGLAYGYARYLLPYCDGAVQRKFLKDKVVDIFYIFIRACKIEYAVQTIIYLQDFDIITPRQYHYEVFNIPMILRHNNSSDLFLYNYIEMVMTEIWSNTTLQMKEAVLKEYLLRTLGEFLDHNHNIWRPFPRDSRFVVAFLADTDAQLKGLHE